VGKRNVHSKGIANKKLANLDTCLVHAAFEDRWIAHLMIDFCLGVCGVILGTTSVSHLSHEARDTKEVLQMKFSTHEKKEEKELISLQVCKFLVCIGKQMPFFF
jgi:hypothetical protein